MSGTESIFKRPLKTRIEQLSMLFDIIPNMSRGYNEKSKKRWWEEKGKKFKIGLIRSHDLNTEFTVINETFNVAKNVKENTPIKPTTPVTNVKKEIKNAGFNTDNNIKEEVLTIKPEKYFTAKDFDRLYLGWVDKSSFPEKDKKIIKMAMKQLFRFIFGNKTIHQVNDFHTRLIIAYTPLTPIEKIPCDTDDTSPIQRKLREHFRMSLQFRLDLVRKEVVAGTTVLGEEAIYVDDKKDLLLGLRDILNALDSKESECIIYGDDDTMVPDKKSVIDGDYDRLLKIFKALIEDRKKNTPSFPTYEIFRDKLVKGELTNTKKGKELYTELLGLLDRATMKHAEELEGEIKKLSEMIELANKQHELHIEVERLKCKKESEKLPGDPAAIAALQAKIDEIERKAKAAAAGLPEGDPGSLADLLKRLANLLGGTPKDEDTLEGLLAQLAAAAALPLPAAPSLANAARIAELQDQLAAARAAAAPGGRDPVANAATIARLEGELADSRATHQRLLQETVDALAQQQTLRQRVVELEAAAAAGQPGAPTAAELQAARQAEAAATAQVGLLQQQIEALEARPDITPEALRALQGQVAAAQQRAQQAEAALAALQQEPRADPVRLAAAEQALAEAQAALARQRTDHEAAMAAAQADAAGRIAAAEARLQEQGQNAAALADARAEIAAGQAALDQQQAAITERIREAEAAAAGATERAEVAEARVRELQERAGVTGAELEQARQAAAAAEAARVAAQAELVRQQEAAEDATAVARGTIADLQEAVRNLTARAEAAEIGAGELGEQIRAAAEERARLQADIDRIGPGNQAELARLREQLAATSHTLILLLNLPPGTDITPEVIDARIAGIAALEDQIGELQLTIGALEAELARSPRQEELDDLRARLGAALAEIARLRAALPQAAGGGGFVAPGRSSAVVPQADPAYPPAAPGGDWIANYFAGRGLSQSSKHTSGVTGKTFGQMSQPRPATAISATGQLARVARATIAVGNSGSGIKPASLPPAGKSGQQLGFGSSAKRGGGSRETPLLSQDSFCETMLTLLLLHAQQAQGESFDLQSFLDKAAATLDDLGQCPIVLHTLNKLLDDTLESNTNGEREGIYFSRLKNSPQDELAAIERAYNNRFSEEEQDILEYFRPQILFSKPPEEYKDILGTKPYMLNVNSMGEEDTPLYGFDEDPADPIILDSSERESLTTGGISLGGLLFLYLNCLRQIQGEGITPNLNSKCPPLIPKRSKEMAKTPKAKSPRKRLPQQKKKSSKKSE